VAKGLFQNPKKRNDPIDEDDEGARTSIISERNKNVEKQYSKNGGDPGFFDKILMKFGCITRDNKKDGTH